MKIFLDLRNVRPGMSGVGTAAGLLWQSLQTQDSPHDFTGIFLKGSAPGGPHAPNFHVMETGVDYTRHLQGEWWLNLNLPAMLRRLGADLFHGPAFLAPFRKTPFRKVVTINDMIAFRFPETYSWKFSRYVRFATRLSARAADRIIAPSCSARDDLEQILDIPRHKIDMIPHHVSPHFKPCPPGEKQVMRQKYKLPERYILCVSTLEPRKNQITLVKAFEILREKSDFPHKLVLVGGRGHDSEKILRTIRNSPRSDDIIHFERMEGEALRACYWCADLFVLPSFYEGFGLPVLEAMQSGVPVIAGDASSLPELVGEGGILVPPGSEKQLAETMIQMLSSPELRAEYSQKGLNQAAQFTPSHTARLTIETYEKCMKELER